MTRVATATSSQIAADAALDVAARGGNAIDCAVAAALVTMNTEPGVCSLAGGCYVTVCPARGDPVTIDGNVAVPGLDLAPGLPDAVHVDMDYGGGIRTLVGCGSVAVPGTPAALAKASARNAALPWDRLVEPAIERVRAGFPLSRAAHHYLQYSGKTVFGRSRDGYSSLHTAAGEVREAGSTIRIPHLADTLERLARDGAESFYRGELAAVLVEHVAAGGGRLTAADLAGYAARVRRPLLTEIGGWQVASNPPPAVGGTVLAALLSAFRDRPAVALDAGALARLVAVQRAVLRYRRGRLDLSDDIEGDARELLSAASAADFPAGWVSASTVHTSAVDDDGNACSITASSGYGSGEMPEGTGLWLNNCLGELELNRRGLEAGPPGRRLPSNMTPGAARSGASVLAFGSPGADRITTALQQFLLAYLQQGRSLEDAIAAPRLHVEIRDDGDRVALEPGLDLPAMDLPVRRFPETHMYFGGVAAAACLADGTFEVAADPRREGGVCIAGGV